MSWRKKRARESRTSIEKIYVTMRHLFNRGSYKPNGTSGSSLRKSLIQLSPEIYGSIADPEKVELDGLLYIMERLPKGIEECQFIKLIAREGFEQSTFEALVPPKRRRNCYRIDEDSMYIEMTRGRSDIYDILTHLTFLYNEADKIKENILDLKGRPTDDWIKLGKITQLEKEEEPFDLKKGITYLANVLGRTFEEVYPASKKFEESTNCNSLFHIAWWLGNLSVEEHVKKNDREITFSTRLKDNIGHHIYGDAWATSVKKVMKDHNLLDRPIHIISANLHSVMNTVYGHAALPQLKDEDIQQLALATSKAENHRLREKISKFALKHGMIEVQDHSGTNLEVQIFDLTKTPPGAFEPREEVLVVMDYAFGEQAFECMDELLKPFRGMKAEKLNVRSVSIMGKAGILEGDKGDIMIPTAHVFEGTADNYPFENQLQILDFEGNGLNVFRGPMTTVLGTSLQNRDVLEHFRTSTWNAIGIEMEGVHYQKAIQSASMIRNSIPEDVKLMYAYYASDNPLETGKTLASGSLGPEGVKPTYLITQKILEKILETGIYEPQTL